MKAEKQALAGGFKQPNASVAVGGSSDGIGRLAAAASGREGGRGKWGKTSPSGGFKQPNAGVADKFQMPVFPTTTIESF